jgi:hypothetical protein
VSASDTYLTGLGYTSYERSAISDDTYPSFNVTDRSDFFQGLRCRHITGWVRPVTLRYGSPPVPFRRSVRVCVRTRDPAHHLLAMALISVPLHNQGAGHHHRDAHGVCVGRLPSRPNVLLTPRQSRPSTAPAVFLFPSTDLACPPGSIPE